MSSHTLRPPHPLMQRPVVCTVVQCQQQQAGDVRLKVLPPNEGHSSPTNLHACRDKQPVADRDVS